MKKTFKRAGVAVLSMAMLLSMGAIGAISASAEGEGTITVSVANNVTAGTVKMYKVAQINGLGNWEWVSPFTSATDFSTIKNYEENSAETKALASALARQVTASTAAVDTGSFVKADDTTTPPTKAVESVELTAAAGTGYYLVVVESTDAGTFIQPILKQIKDGDTATASVKGSTLTLDKSIEEIADSASTVASTKNTGVAAKGDKIEYKISTSIPTYDSAVEADNIRSFVITDTPTTGIKISNATAAACNLNVQIDGTDSEDYTFATSGDGFTITLSGTQVKNHMGESIDITFDAELDTDAVVNAANTNEATLTYGNDYATGGGEATLEDEVYVYTVNLEGVKVKQGDTNTKLPNAEFKLYRGTKESANLVGTVKTGADGKISFDRLTEGTYILEESKAPDGYKAISDQTIVITGTKASNDYTGAFTADNIFTTFEAGTLKGNIEDPTADALPGTGGMGTTLFTIGGAAIVLLAGAMFVVYMRRRKNEE